MKLEGSPLERSFTSVPRARAARACKKFRPLCYLTDEWGCPSGEPVIGIPFYLADPKLRAAREGDEATSRDEREIMMYLRHEAGHAFNYAYELYGRPSGATSSADFRRPYRDDYRPRPFLAAATSPHRRLVRAEAPDEDFAETFAVWLTPRSQWRKRYTGWAAMRSCGTSTAWRASSRDAEPLRRTGHGHHGRRDGDDRRGVLQEALEKGSHRSSCPRHGPRRHLQVSRRRKKGVRPAANMLKEYRKTIVDKVAYWTGVHGLSSRSLVESVVARVGELEPLARTRARKGAHRGGRPRTSPPSR